MSLAALCCNLKDTGQCPSNKASRIGRLRKSFHCCPSIIHSGIAQSSRLVQLGVGNLHQVGTG